VKDTKYVATVVPTVAANGLHQEARISSQSPRGGTTSQQQPDHFHLLPTVCIDFYYIRSGYLSF